MTVRRAVLTGLAMLSIGATAGAAQSPQFSNVTIKRNPIRSGSREVIANGTVQFYNVPLRALVQRAFGVEWSYIDGPPGFEDARYDIDATIPNGASGDKLNAMFRQLLDQRLSLGYHREVRAREGYALKQAEAEQLSLYAEGGSRWPSGKPGRVVVDDASGIIHIDRPVTVSHLARLLTGMMKRPVLDRTGAVGTYWLKLDGWVGPGDSRRPERPVISGDGATLSGDAPPIQVVLRRFGLTLEPAVLPIDYFVIDTFVADPQSGRL